MEAMNGWHFFPMHENETQTVNQQEAFAIRRFCPARLNHQVEEWDKITFNEMELELEGSPTYSIGSLSPLLGASEEEEFVDSFFNVDSGENYAIDESSSPEKNQAFDHLQGGLAGNFCLINDVNYGDVPLVIVEELEMSCSYENFDVVSAMVPSGSSGLEEADGGVDQQLNLVHLLLACAEAVGCRDTQVADSILSQMWPLVSPFGDSLQRVSYCFAIGLKYRLWHLNNVNVNGTFSKGTPANAMDASLMITREQKMEAFQLLNQTTPFIAFGFMAANDAINQASRGKDCLHIIDLGMEHALQWPSLIRALASRTDGPPKLLRITGIIEDKECLFDLQVSMNAVVDDAKSIGMPLEFNAIVEPLTPSLLTREKLNLREGEILFVNSIMHLHNHVRESRGSLKTILQSIKKLCPTLLTVVEQDANHNGPFFLGRFLESLHYYSAIFDSLEASLPRNSPQRMKIEKFHLAEEICNIVACEGSDRIERHEGADQWRRQLGRAGFQVVGSLNSVSQVSMMLSVYGCDGYTLVSEKGCLLLGWRGRPLMLASAWHVNDVSSS